MEAGSNKEGYTGRTVSTQKGELKATEGAANWEVLSMSLSQQYIIVGVQILKT